MILMTIILGDLRNDNQVIKWMLDELKQEEIKSVTVIISCQFQLPKSTKGAHPCTSSSEQGGCKRVLEAFF